MQSFEAPEPVEGPLGSGIDWSPDRQQLHVDRTVRIGVD